MKKAKKYLSLLLSIVLVLSISSAFIVAFADETLVTINAENFPDPVWRAIVLDNFDTNADGYLNAEERGVTTVPVSAFLDDGEIENLKGIEYFQNTESLYVGEIGLKSLDVSSLANLKYLSCQGNQISELDVSKNTNLIDLNCWDNGMTKLLLPSNIKKLQCQVNKLTSLDLSSCILLETLSCYQNELSALNLTPNTALSSLNCSYNHLLSLDLGTTAITTLTGYMINNQTATATVDFNNDEKYIYVPLLIDEPTKVASSDVDVYKTDAETEDQTMVEGYFQTFEEFRTTNYDSVLDGNLVYYYDTGLAGAENMQVILSFEKSFYRVRFMTAENGEVLKTEYTYDGKNITPPAFPSAPDGVVCPSWSESYVGITADKDLYINWSESHTYEAKSISDGVVTVRCTVCGDEYTKNFKDLINSKVGDESYDSAIDVNKDGIINSRDFSIAIRM